MIVSIMPNHKTATYCEAMLSVPLTISKNIVDMKQRAENGVVTSSRCVYIYVPTAVVGGLSFCLGPIISGTVVSKIKLSVSGALKFIMVINMTSCIGFVVMGFLGCDKPRWAGSLALDG